MSVLRCTLFGLLLLAAFVVASLTAEPGAWREAVDWARTYRRASTAEVATCPVLIGAEHPGDARASYDHAGNLALRVAYEDREALRATLLDATSTREQALALVAGLPQDAMRELRRATRQSGKVFSAARLGTRTDGLPFGDVVVLCDAVLVLARHARSEQERLHAWLDAVACGWDMAGSELPVAELLGLVVVERAMEVADAHWLQALSSDRLRQLSVALAKVDDAIPVTIDLRTTTAHMVLMVDESGDLQPFDIGMRSIYQSWDNLFSIKDAAIDRIGRLVAQVQMFLRETPRVEAWSARKRRLARLVFEDQLCNEDLGSGYLSFALASEQNRRGNVAKLRLLRMAVAHLLEQELVLADPLGDGMLRVARGAGPVRFLSKERGLVFEMTSSNSTNRGR